MNYTNYLAEINERKNLGLNPKPIQEAELLSEIILQIKDTDSIHREDSLKFFIYNTIPGTTPAATEKAKFLKEIIQNEHHVEEVSTEFAFELLSHMKGGPSIKILLELALGKSNKAKKAANVLKTQVFLYEADMEILKKEFTFYWDLRSDKNSPSYPNNLSTDIDYYLPNLKNIKFFNSRNQSVSKKSITEWKIIIIEGENKRKVLKDWCKIVSSIFIDCKVKKKKIFR